MLIEEGTEDEEIGGIHVALGIAEQESLFHITSNFRHFDYVKSSLQETFLIFWAMKEANRRKPYIIRFRLMKYI